MAIFAPVIPLVPDDVSGYKMYTDLKSVVSFHLKNLLLTSPGERIHDPNYGVGVKRFLFEQSTPANLARLESRISSKINSYLSYINLRGVRVTADPDSYKVNVSIEYYIPYIKEIDELTLELVPNSVAVETTNSALEKIF